MRSPDSAKRPVPIRCAAAMSLIELNRSPYVHGLSQNESLSLPHFSEQVVLCLSVRIDDRAFQIVPSCCCCLV
jgi:hypothetical protein